MEYKIKKVELKKEDVEYFKIYFENGDCLPIHKSEIFDFSINLYDRLIISGEYNQSFCSVVQSGFIKLKIVDKIEGYPADAFLCDLNVYKKDRISYIKKRLCSNNDMKCIQVFNKNYWSYTFYGNIKSELVGEFLIIKFEPNKKEPYNGKDNFIILPEVNKSIIKSIMLDFENCEGFEIFNNEIIEIKLKFKKELLWGSRDYNRGIDSGYIKLKLNKDINNYREIVSFNKFSKGKKGNKQLISRLCEQKDFDLHDICHLYINYEYAGTGFYRRECIEVSDIRNSKEAEKIEKYETERKQEFNHCYIGGCCQKLENGTILISFGKTALNNIKSKKNF